MEVTVRKCFIELGEADRNKNISIFFSPKSNLLDCNNNGISNDKGNNNGNDHSTSKSNSNNKNINNNNGPVSSGIQFELQFY